MQYPVSYTHKSLGRTRHFTLPASAGTQTCLLCLSLKSQIPFLVFFYRHSTRMYLMKEKQGGPGGLDVLRHLFDS